MATRSAAKAHRQSLKRRLRNRAVKSATKTTVGLAVARIASGDLDAARDEVRAAISALDRAAQKGVMHPNKAARGKSRLLLKYNAAVAARQIPIEEPRPRRSKPPAQQRSRPSSGRSSTRKPTKK